MEGYKDLVLQLGLRVDALFQNLRDVIKRELRFSPFTRRALITAVNTWHMNLKRCLAMMLRTLSVRIRANAGLHQQGQFFLTFCINDLPSHQGNTAIHYVFSLVSILLP